MAYKKMFAIILSVLTVLSMTACKDNSVAEDNRDITSNNSVEETTYSDINENMYETYLTTEEENTDVSSSEQAAELSTTAVSVKNPATLTKAEIVDIYKKAAQKSSASAVSQHSVTVTKISINNEELGGGFDFIKKIISTFISNNSEDSKGITGGYNNLTESDVYSARAYAVGENTAIEIVLNEQTDGAKGSIHGGSVGHAIDVVGDISTVTDELTELGLPIEISSETTSIHYTNPVVKVLIDGNGRIVKGTWKYTVDIRLDKFKAFGADVENASIVMDNVITVNGGFSK